MFLLFARSYLFYYLCAAMQNRYIRITIHTDAEEYLRDILVYNLHEKGCDGFEENDSGAITAYCKEELFDEGTLATLLPLDARYRIEPIDPKQWERFIKAY